MEKAGMKEEEEQTNTDTNGRKERRILVNVKIPARVENVDRAIEMMGG